MSTVFDPQEFFAATTTFASQGRGKFTIPTPPQVFVNLPMGTPEEKLCSSGWGLLRSGLVASSATAPGMQVATYEPFSYSGPTRKQVHTQVFGDIDVEFLLMGGNTDLARSVYHTFMTWQELMVGVTGRGRVNSSEADVPTADTDAFALAYYDNYVAETAEIVIYSPTINGVGDVDPVIRNKYYQIYPVNIGAMRMSWDAPDAPMVLPVTFTYYYMKSMIAKP